MIKYLVKLVRSKPKALRDNIAMGIAAGFTAIIFSVWLYNLPAKNAELAENLGEDAAPGFSQLFSEVGDQITTIKEAIKEESGTESVTEAEEGEGQIDMEAALQSEDLSSVTKEFPTQPLASTTLETSTSSVDVGLAEEEVSADPRVVRITTTNDSTSTATSTAQ